MKAPYFDVTRIPLHPSDPNWMSAVVNEERRVCGAIDERLDDISNDFVSIANEATELESRLRCTRGFFARWSIRRRIKALSRRVSDNLAVRNELVTARWKRTYGA